MKPGSRPGASEPQAGESGRRVMRFVKKDSICLSGTPDLKAVKRAGEDGIHGTFPQAGPKGGRVFRCGETPFSGIKTHFTERDGREGDLAYISPRGSLAPLPALGLHLDLQPAHALCPLTGIGLVGRCVTSSHRVA